MTPSASQVHRQVWASLRDRPPTERDDLAEEVLAWAGLPPEARDTHRTLRSAELERLASDDLIEIGAHTANHPRLAALAPECQQREIEDGRSALEAFISRPVTSFAYPHGGPDDVGSTTPGQVRAAGFGTAYLAAPGGFAPGATLTGCPGCSWRTWTVRGSLVCCGATPGSM